jgi:hypothetical protein
MSISRALMDGLGGRAPLTSGVQRLEAIEAGLASVRCDVVAADGVGCAIAKLECQAIGRGPAAADLARYANDLCKRVTYLMEPLRVVEFDPKAGALVLSEKPRRKGDSVGYYHLHAKPSGATVLHRVEFSESAKQRVFSPFALTHDQLEQLVDDLVDLQRISD